MFSIVVSTIKVFRRNILASWGNVKIDKNIGRAAEYWEQVKAEEQINYLTKASIGYGIEKRVGKRQK